MQDGYISALLLVPSSTIVQHPVWFNLANRIRISGGWVTRVAWGSHAIEACVLMSHTSASPIIYRSWKAQD